MAGGYRRSRTHKGRKEISKKYRTRRRTKDLDQIHEDLSHGITQTSQPVDEDLPGGGQFYCVECSRHFQNDESLTEHKRSKLHKKRIKLLKERPYTIEEAEAAGGLGTADFYATANSSMQL